MENTKIVFAVEDIQVIQDPVKQFSKIRLKISRAGDNLHHLPISDNALSLAAPTLLKKPILCHIIKNGTAMGGHENGEQVVGFLDEQYFEEIDGVRWQCATALLWRIYFPDVISIFSKSKDNTVSVSMEINVLEASENEMGQTVIEKFEYTATTLIGVQPAIPEALATMVEFSKAVEEYETNKRLFGLQITHFPVKGKNLEVHLKNSQYAEFDFDYAIALKSEYPNVWGRGGNLRGEETFSMWGKAHSEDKSPATLDWIREREQWGKRHNRDKSPAGVVAQVKWGMVSDYGIESMKATLEKSKSEYDSKNRAYFEEEKQEIKKEVEEMTDEVKDKVEEEKLEMAAPPEDEKKETPAEAAKEKAEGESPDEEKKETPADEKKEEPPAPKKAKMSEFCDMEKMSEFVKESEFAAEFAAEAVKEDGVDFAVVVKACYSSFCKMAEKFAASEKDKEAYMAKMQEYEARFAELEKQKFSIEVESQLQEVSDVLSKDEIEECRTDAVNFSLETVDGWKNKVKALGFTKTKGKKPVDTVIKYALPFHNEPENTEHLLFKGGSK